MNLRHIIIYIILTSSLACDKNRDVVEIPKPFLLACSSLDEPINVTFTELSLDLHYVDTFNLNIHMNWPIEHVNQRTYAGYHDKATNEPGNSLVTSEIYGLPCTTAIDGTASPALYRLWWINMPKKVGEYEVEWGVNNNNPRENSVFLVLTQFDSSSWATNSKWEFSTELPESYFHIEHIDTVDCHCMQGKYDVWLQSSDTDEETAHLKKIIHIYDDAFCIPLEVPES